MISKIIQIKKVTFRSTPNGNSNRIMQNIIHKIKAITDQQREKKYTSNALLKKGKTNTVPKLQTMRTRLLILLDWKSNSKKSYVKKITESADEY